MKTSSKFNPACAEWEHFQQPIKQKASGLILVVSKTVINVLPLDIVMPMGAELLT